MYYINPHLENLQVAHLIWRSVFILTIMRALQNYVNRPSLLWSFFKNFIQLPILQFADVKIIKIQTCSRNFSIFSSLLCLCQLLENSKKCPYSNALGSTNFFMCNSMGVSHKHSKTYYSQNTDYKMLKFLFQVRHSVLIITLNLKIMNFAKR